MPESGGDSLLVGTYGDWRQGGDAHKIALGRRHKLTPEERATIRKRMAADAKRTQAARQHRADQSAARAARMWRDQYLPMEPDAPHSYPTAKNVRAYGLRLSRKGALSIPVCDAAGKIHGLQLILDKGKHGKAIRRLGRDKVFHPSGMAKRGHFHLIGAPRPGSVLLIAEGFATAASLHEATSLPVAVAFDCGNLEPVASALRKHYRGLLILVCADDDYLARCKHCKKQVVVAEPDCPHCGKPHECINTGTIKASAAAVAVSGEWIAPIFADRQGRRWTDWNDLAQAEGLHMVRSQIEERIVALGWQLRAAPTPTGGAGACKTGKHLHCG